MVRRALDRTYRGARRILVLVAGVSVLVVGVVMLVLPGPAILVIPAGLAILGLEFAWARRWLARFRERAGDALASWRARASGTRAERAPVRR